MFREVTAFTGAALPVRAGESDAPPKKAAQEGQFVSPMQAVLIAALSRVLPCGCGLFLLAISSLCHHVKSRATASCPRSAPAGV
jgi:hypothetical protein